MVAYKLCKAVLELNDKGKARKPASTTIANRSTLPSYRHPWLNDLCNLPAMVKLSIQIAFLARSTGKS
jgi:hypothetical protein